MQTVTKLSSPLSLIHMMDIGQNFENAVATLANCYITDINNKPNMNQNKLSLNNNN